MNEGGIRMKKQMITLTVASMLLSSCGIYSKYKPTTNVPDNLYGEEIVSQEDTSGLGQMNWQEVFTDQQLQTLIEIGLQNNTD